MKDTSSRSQLKDSELTARVRRGETEWLDVLIERYYDGIFRFCCCKTGSREAAYDCTQETFLHLLRYLEAYTEQKKFKAWLYRIASNVCTDYFRKAARETAGEEVLELLQEEDRRFEQIEQRELVRHALPVFRKCRGKPSCSISLTGLSCGRLRKSRIQKCLP